MKQKKHSVIVVSITPFAANGAFDEAAYRKHLQRLSGAGCSVYVASISSETHTMSPDEIDQVLAVSYEELNGKVPFRAMGFEPRKASELVAYMEQVRRAGFAAAQIFSLDMGHGAKPTEAEMELYYSTIIDSTPLDIWLSCHPRTMGYHLPLSMIERLCEKYPQFKGFAYGGLDLSYHAELIHRFGDRLEIHNAGPAISVNTLSLGGNGFMGLEGNFAPNLVQSVINAWDAQDYAGLSESYGKLMRLAAILQGITSIKPLMNAFGFPAGHLRPPRLPIAGAELQKKIEQIVALDIPGIPKPVASMSDR